MKEKKRQQWIALALAFAAALCAYPSNSFAVTAVDDSYTVLQDTTLEVPAPGVMGNDVWDCPGGGTQEVTVVDSVDHGAFSSPLDRFTGSFAYQPEPSFTGTDTFTYQAVDGCDTFTATVTITVTAAEPTNHAPVAADDEYQIEWMWGNPIAWIDPPGPLGNDVDPDGGLLTMSIIDQPLNGVIAMSDPSGTLVYLSFTLLPDSMTYVAVDGSGAQSNVATITFLPPPPAAPEAAGDSYIAIKDTPLNVSAPGVLSNDSDPAGQPLTAALAAAPLNGDLVLGADGSFTYAPFPGHLGPDSFTYIASNGTLGSETTTVVLLTQEAESNWVITTAAGGGQTLYPVHTLPARDIHFAYPADVALDQAGNLYISDYYAYHVYQLSPDGMITRAVGQVELHSGFGGDGGPADAAYLNLPYGLALDAAGNLFIADGSNYRVRKVDAAGIITTVAGSGAMGDSGDGGPALSASFTRPLGLAVDAAGNLYISDPSAQRVRKVDVTGTITTVAGNGTIGDSGDGGPALSAQLRFPSSLCLDQAGNLYIADTEADRVRKVDTAGIITTVAEIDAPNGIDIDAAGNLYVTSKASHRMFKVDAAGTVILIAGNGLPNGIKDAIGDGGPALLAELDTPECIAVDPAGDRIYFVDRRNYSVRLLTRNESPVAADDAFAATEDTALDIAAPGVLANDTDSEGGALTAELAAPPANGQVTLNADGSFGYTPAADFYGTDSFTYTANDGMTSSNIATVTLTVAAVNDAPAAADDAYETSANLALTVPAPGVLGNDADAENDPLTATLVSEPANGYLELAADGSFTFTPNPGFAGADSFTYTAGDGTDLSHTATVAITVQGPMTYVVRNTNDSGPDSLRECIAAANAHSGWDTITFELPAYPATIVLTGPLFIINDALAITGPGAGNLTLDANHSGGRTVRTFQIQADMNISGLTVQNSYDLYDGGAIWIQSNRTVSLSQMVFQNNTAGLSGGAIRNFGWLTLTDVTLTGNTAGTGGGAIANSHYITGERVTAESNSAAYGGAIYSDHSVAFLGAVFRNNTAAADGGALYLTGMQGNLFNATVTGNSAEETGGGIYNAVFVVMGNSTVSGNTGAAGGGVFSSSEAMLAAINVTFSGNASTGFAGGAILNYGVTMLVNMIASGNTSPGGVSYAEFGESQGFMGNICWPDATLPGLNADPLLGPLADNGGFSPTHALLRGSPAIDAGVDMGIPELAPDQRGVVRPQGAGFDIGAYEAQVPTATDDTYAANEDLPLAVDAPGVLGNDTFLQGAGLTAVLTGGPANGTLSLNADGSFIYTPDLNFFGGDSFTYTADDGSYGSNAATVSITVAAQNDAPVAVDDAYELSEDSYIYVDAPAILANDTDVENDELSRNIVDWPLHGWIALDPSGSMQYVPFPDYFGTDSFTYQVNDGTDDSNVATVTFTIHPVNDAPGANGDSYSTDEDTPLAISAPGLLGNDTDADFDALQVLTVSEPLHGTVMFDADGAFIYTPAANFYGEDSFTYQITDTTATSGEATVLIVVGGINDAPVAADDSYTTAEDVPLAVAAAGALANDSDIDGDPLTAALVDAPLNGSVEFAADGSFTYTPAADFYGADSFTYEVSDGELISDVATVVLAVTAVNDAPLALDDYFSTNEDVVLALAAPGVSGNDIDVDGDALTAMTLSGPVHGSLTFNADGSFTYSPDANYYGEDSFTYQINDGAVDSNIATVYLTVTAVNDPPAAGNDSYETFQDMLLTVAAPGVLANDSDPVEGSPVTAALVSAPAHGALTLNADGSFTYMPAANFNGADSFSYVADDGEAESNVALVNITVISAGTMIDMLMSDVQALAADGMPNGGQTNALLNKLTNAQSQLAKNKPEVAINMMNAFINQVNAFRGNQFTTAEADALIAQANAIIAALN